MLPMPRGRIKNIVIGVIVVIIVICISIYAYLYFTTDLFKSNASLFGKYLVKSAQNFEEILIDEKGEEYANLLQNNKYVSNAELTATYKNGIGTTGENTNNVINKLKLKVDGMTDKAGGMDYKNVILQKEDQNVVQLELLKSENRYGIHFSDLFDKYLAVDNKDLKEVAANIGIEESEDLIIPNMISDADLRQSMMFTYQEMDDLNSTVEGIISQDFSNKEFSKTKKANITINDKTLETNSYTLKINKEQMNNVYIKILEELKQNEIILSKIRQIDDFMNPPNPEETENPEGQPNENQNTTGQPENGVDNTVYNPNATQTETPEPTEGNEEEEDSENNEEGESTEENSQEKTEPKTAVDKFTKKIDDMINQIRNKNIGVNEATITVYENNGDAVRTVLQIQEEYRIVLDTIINSKEDMYVNISKEVFGIEENKDDITVERKGDQFAINRDRAIGESEYKTNIVQDRVVVNGKEEQNIRVEYDTGVNKIQLKYVDKKEIRNDFDKVPGFTDNNNLVLNYLSDDEYTQLREILNDKVIEEVNKVSEEVNFDELFKILSDLEIIPEQIKISDIMTLTKTEVSKFNAQFEIYKGREVDTESIDRLLELIKVNLASVTQISDSTIKLEIQRGVVNEELANKVSEIINSSQNSSKKYTINYEYDQETQLLNAITIEMTK